jgi:hypothetical protein
VRLNFDEINCMRKDYLLLQYIQGTENSPAINHVSDEEVVESSRNPCHPIHGVMGAYLSERRMCLVIGGAKFMHGSLPIIPEAQSQYEYVSNERTDIDARKRFWA